MRINFVKYMLKNTLEWTGRDTCPHLILYNPGFRTFAAQSIHYFVSTIACGFLNGMEINEPC
jgi:hypothetical protein